MARVRAMLHGGKTGDNERSARTLGEDGLLAGELLKHLGGAGEAISALADGGVEHQLLSLVGLSDLSAMAADVKVRGRFGAWNTQRASSLIAL